MKTLVFFLEESSAQEFLTGFLPRILPEGVTSRFIPFEGKQDLDKQLERRIRGWNTPDSLFVVLRDQDQGDCKKSEHGKKKFFTGHYSDNSTKRLAIIRLCFFQVNSKNKGT